MQYSFYDIKQLKTDTFDELTQTWNKEIRNFWAKHNDRIYQFYILPLVFKVNPSSKVLEIGAQYYSKYLKSILGRNYSFSLLDIKPSNHPDVKCVLHVDSFINCDLTKPIKLYINKFDFVISFGVLSYYNFSKSECSIYLNNLLKMLKEGGVCAIKIDIKIFNRMEKFNNYIQLTDMIKEYFNVFRSDSIHERNGNLQWLIYYCKSKELVNDGKRTITGG